MNPNGLSEMTDIQSCCHLLKLRCMEMKMKNMVRKRGRIKAMVHEHQVEANMT